jgi:2-polyprenyl-3-methyl-5-hydroxy-6-metoxy-1,4-benzoquinol methylase
MLYRQQELCAICGEKETKNKALSVDHCHTTSKIRGLLCSKCNVAMGAFNDDIEMLNKVIRYLKGETMYNKTNLDLDKAEERYIHHRDYIAHALRWAHVMKYAKSGQNILDLGAADFPLAMMFYTNKFSPEIFVGVEIRESMITKAKEKLVKVPFPVKYIQADLCKEFNKIPILPYDVIVSFEFIEHIDRELVEPFLINVKELMNDKTLFFLSTPCYDGINKAANHLYEWRFNELKTLLEKHFLLENYWGTFMNQAAFKEVASHELVDIFERLREYYDSNYLATIFAPLFPEKARNCIWTLRRQS